MMRLLLKKFLILIFSLLCVISGTFFLMHFLPGDPFIGEQNMPPEILASLRLHYGLDQPLYVQFWIFLKEIFQGNLGHSITYPGRSVSKFIREGLPISAQLGAQALFIAIPTGILLGSWAAIRKNQWQDGFAMLLSTLGVSVPSFVLASFLQLLFCIKFPLLPVARWGTFEHTILPSIALSFLPTAYITRLIRSNLVEVMQQDYIQTALAKGLPLFTVAFRHGLRNAILPTLAYLGPIITQILTGSFMIEKIFAIPGLGQWMIYSIHARDYPLIIGLTLFFSFFLMLSVFLIDLISSFIDPRVRHQNRIPTHA